MFYLVEFLKIMKTHIVLSSLFLVSTLGLVLVGSQYNTVYSRVLSKNSKEISGPYFSALIDKKMQLDGVIRRVQNLPGVVKVEVSSEKQLKSEVQKLQSTFGHEFVNNLTTLNMKNMKILLDVGIKDRSFTLIKEYIERLVGKKEVTIGALKYPETNKRKTNKELDSILSYLNVYGLIILGALWLISFILMVKLIHSKAFIIEKFQRRTLVAFKMVYSGLGTIIVLGTLGHYFLLGDIDYVLSLVVLGMLAVSAILIKMIPKKFVGA